MKQRGSAIQQKVVHVLRADESKNCQPPGPEQQDRPYTLAPDIYQRARPNRRRSITISTIIGAKMMAVMVNGI